eukprot:11537059-Karenia_brevis.AAC.1
MQVRNENVANNHCIYTYPPVPKGPAQSAMDTISPQGLGHDSQCIDDDDYKGITPQGGPIDTFCPKDYSALGAKGINDLGGSDDDEDDDDGVITAGGAKGRK